MNKEIEKLHKKIVKIISNGAKSALVTGIVIKIIQLAKKEKQISVEDELKTKLKLLAVYFTKSRDVKGEFWCDLIELDEYWNKIYEENRITMGSFEKAQIYANECVVNKIMLYP